MSNIIGEPLEPYVARQIIARQYLHGSGVRVQNEKGLLSPQPNQVRSEVQINLLNSNTSWIKLGSGVSISKSRLEDVGFTHAQQEKFAGIGLAKNNILFGGTAALGVHDVQNQKTGKTNHYDFLSQREGFLPRDPNSSYTYDPDFGFSPMAGIESIDVKTLNRGSLKKATVKLKANDRNQFNIIDLLYLRLGYTVLLEWGNSIFTPDGEHKKLVRNTLMEEMFFDKLQNGSYLDMLDPIENKRTEYSGNYDALLGKVSNFSWSFNTDGSYDIELTIISLGDVVESLKTNISVDKGTFTFLQAAGTPTTNEEDPESSTLIEDNKDANIISSLLYVWKYLNPPLETPSPYHQISINTSDGQSHVIGNYLKTSQEGSELDVLTSNSYTVEFTVSYDYVTADELRSREQTEDYRERYKQAGEL